MSIGVRQPVSWWKRLVRLSCLVLAGVVVLLVTWRFALNRLIAAEISAIHERSYPATLPELNRWYPRVPPSQNGAVVFGKAFASLSDQGNPSHPSRGDTAAPTPQDGSPADPQTQSVEDYLNGNSEALALLHQASTIPRSRFPIDLGRLSISPYAHWGNLIRSAHLLEAEAANHAEHASPQLAVVSVESLFGMSQSLAREPLVRSYLTRMDCQRIAIGSLQDLLGKTSLTDADLDALQATLEKIDDQRGLARAFIGQRCIGIYGFDLMRDTFDLTGLPVARKYPWGQRLFINLNVFFGSPAYLYDLCGFLQWDKLHYLRLMDRYIEAAQTAFPERIETAQRLHRSLGRQNQLHALSRVWLRGMDAPRVILKDAHLTAKIRAAQVAIAIERFRLAHDQLPQNLAQLGPCGTGAVPADPFDGQPLRYQRLPTGYAIYSVGDGATDDGGGEVKDVAFLVER
ncbi:MAG TPA: hypothetical protein VLZ30_09865 [Verrucomicrobiae bacterium]|nr:hypothetical protein [Verrucomicrobiae bacterium]